MVSLNPINPFTPAITEQVLERKTAQAVLKTLAEQPAATKEQLIAQLLPGEADASMTNWVDEVLSASQIGADLTAIFEDIAQLSPANQAALLAAAYRTATPGSRNAEEIAAKLEDLINAQPELADINYTTEALDPIAQVFIEEVKLRNEPQPARSRATLAAIAGGVALALLGIVVGVKVFFRSNPIPPKPPVENGFCPANFTNGTSTVQSFKPVVVQNDTSNAVHSTTLSFNKVIEQQKNSSNTTDVCPILPLTVTDQANSVSKDVEIDAVINEIAEQNGVCNASLPVTISNKQDVSSTDQPSANAPRIRVRKQKKLQDPQQQKLAELARQTYKYS
jgi:hypothetical protein